MTAYTAANRVKKWLVEKYDANPDEVLVLGKSGERTVASHGFYAGSADAQVVYEGAYEWPFASDRPAFDGVHTEAATGFALSFYTEN